MYSWIWRMPTSPCKDHSTLWFRRCGTINAVQSRKRRGRLVVEVYRDIVPVGADVLRSRCLPGSRTSLTVGGAGRHWHHRHHVSVNVNACRQWEAGWVINHHAQDGHSGLPECLGRVQSTSTRETGGLEGRKTGRQEGRQRASEAGSAGRQQGQVRAGAG